MTNSSSAFISHICKYLGVGLISGSVVHAGTLGGAWLKYLILIIIGIIAFLIGTLLEHRSRLDRQLVAYIAISVLVSIGTGMVSGGTQHYLDGPLYAAVLMPLGLLLAYLAFVWRDYRAQISFKSVLAMLLICLALYAALYGTAHLLPSLADHHGTGEHGH